MSQVVSLRPEPLPGAPLAGLFASAQKAAQDGFRLLFLTLGWVLICGGVVLAILPFLHTLGVLLLAIGLIVMLFGGVFVFYSYSISQRAALRSLRAWR